MNQGIASEPMPRMLRLALGFLAALFGLTLLGFAFGSSSASADDGAGSPDSLGSALGGLVSSVADPVHRTVTTVTTAVAPATKPVAAAVSKPSSSAKPAADAVAEVTHAKPATTITAPVAELVDDTLAKLLDGTALGEALGPQPVGSVLAPVAELVDGSVAEVGDVVAPAPAADAAIPAVVATASATAVSALLAPVAVAHGVVSGSAAGSLVLDPAPSALQTGVSGFSSAGITLLAAFASTGFLVLLLLRRTALLDRDLPGSPVFDTDSSPD